MPPRRRERPITLLTTPGAVLAALVGLGPPGCAPATYDPARATRPYPAELHLVEEPGADDEVVLRPLVIDVQVFRRGSELTIINSTAQSYRDVDVWVNQRYMRHVDEIPAGGTVVLSLWEFVDDLGEVFNAGGLFRTIEPFPVRLVQIQVDDEQPLIGLVAIPEGRDR